MWGLSKVFESKGIFIQWKVDIDEDLQSKERNVTGLKRYTGRRPPPYPKPGAQSKDLEGIVSRCLTDRICCL